jgi:BirA family biotin operon repressor/biotin-[acetyl-CoA-carboxylase] ligase
LPLLAGLALALTVEDLYGQAVRLKWPNDLLVRERKLAGVLCEALVEGDSLGVLIGIGLNCNQLSFPPELDSKATSLARELGRRVSLPGLLEELLRKLKVSLADGQWHAKVIERLYGLNRGCGQPEAVVLSTTDRSGVPARGSGQHGIVLGLNQDGSLLFKPEQGTAVSLYGGELRFREDSETRTGR